MSEGARLVSLREMLADDPDDAFTRYALAMELKGQARPDDARAELATLLARSPDYLATYFQYGSLLYQAGDEAAAEVIRQGIEKAAQVGDAHTKSELEGLLAEVEA